MSEKSDVDLTGAKLNTGVWLVKVSVWDFEYGNETEDDAV